MPQTIKETSFLFIIKENLLYTIPLTLVSNLERCSIFLSSDFAKGPKKKPLLIEDAAITIIRDYGGGGGGGAVNLSANVLLKRVFL